MKTVIKKVGDGPTMCEIENTLEALQEAVGGNIEVVTVTTDLAIVCNEEGRLNGSRYNCTILGNQFFGDILFVGVHGEDFGDLPERFRTAMFFRRRYA